MAFTVTISGGSAYGTLNLNDHVNYSISEFVPTVADEEAGLLGEDDPYGHQSEELSVTVYGSTKAAAMLNLKKLVAKIQQAEKWAAGEFLEGNPAVIINYTPDSGATAYQSAVFGSPVGVDTLLGLRPSFNADLEAFVINGVSILIERRGAWLGTSNSINLTAASSPNPMEISMPTSLDFLSPTKLSVRFPHVANGFSTPGYIVLSDVGTAANNMLVDSPGDHITVLNTGFTQVAKGSSKAFSTTSLLRFTAPDTGEYTQDLAGAGVFYMPNLEANMIAVFAGVRNNNQTASFSVSARLGRFQEEVRGEVAYVDKSSGDPQIICLGLYPTGGKPVTLTYLDIEADVAGGILDFDYFFIVGLNSSSSIIYLETFDNADSGGCDPGGGNTFEFDLHIDPCQLESPEPWIYATNVCDTSIGARHSKRYRGNAYLATKGEDMCMAILIPYGAHFVYVDDLSSGDPVHVFDVSVTRQAAELSPM